MMKYVAERGYKDVQLNRHVEEGAVLEEEYKKDNVELTEERINYLVNERKLYKSVEEVPEGKVGDITPVDVIPEGATVVDEVVIVENNTEGEKDLEDAAVDSNEEITKEVEETNEGNDAEGENIEANKETLNEVEVESKAADEEKEKNNKKNNTKTTSKTSTKKEEK